MSRPQVIIDLEPENPDGAKNLKMEATENYNIVAIEIDGHWYDVAIVDLHRATMPFMDMRQEGRSSE